MRTSLPPLAGCKLVGTMPLQWNGILALDAAHTKLGGMVRADGQLHSHTPQCKHVPCGGIACQSGAALSAVLLRRHTCLRHSGSAGGCLCHKSHQVPLAAAPAPAPSAAVQAPVKQWLSPVRSATGGRLQVPEGRVAAGAGQGCHVGVGACHAHCCLRRALRHRRGAACTAGWSCSSLLYPSRLPAQGLCTPRVHDNACAIVCTTEVNLYAPTQV